MKLRHKQILLGITGGIAAYKSAEIIRLLQKQGATVRVVMTEAAKAFVTPLTLQALSGYPVSDDLFDLKAEAAMGHIELARFADIVLIAPVSADFIAKLAQGAGDNLLSAICLATTAPLLLAPAMNHQMWRQEATQKNWATLKSRGFIDLGIGDGYQACGEIGEGRMLEPAGIVKQVITYFENDQLAGQQVVITAGPTREYLDPVRFLSNPSSGKMAYALARSALSAGAAVTIVSGPVALTPPEGAAYITVETAEEMNHAVSKLTCDIFIAAAAVSDYRAEKISEQKIKKTNAPITLTLLPNPDILKNVASRQVKPFCVGFAAETENILQNAQKKFQDKGLDMLCVNDVSDLRIGFGSDDNALTVVWARGEKTIPRASKESIARQVMDMIVMIKKGVW